MCGDVLILQMAFLVFVATKYVKENNWTKIELAGLIVMRLKPLRLWTLVTRIVGDKRALAHLARREVRWGCIFCGNRLGEFGWAIVVAGGGRRVEAGLGALDSGGGGKGFGGAGVGGSLAIFDLGKGSAVWSRRTSDVQRPTSNIQVEEV
jgi:hypothetical protein